MTRLTKTMREELVIKIMDATNFPERKEQIRKDFFNRSTIWAKSFLPPDFNDSIKHLPREWFATCASFSLEIQFHPMQLMKPESDRCYHSADVPVEAFACPLRMLPSKPGYSMVVNGNKQEHVKPWLQELIGRANSWFSEYREVQTQVEQTLAAYGTVEKLLKDFPQFTKHINAPSKTYAVAVAPAKLSALLTATGFDKTEK